MKKDIGVAPFDMEYGIQKRIPQNNLVGLYILEKLIEMIKYNKMKQHEIIDLIQESKKSFTIQMIEDQWSNTKDKEHKRQGFVKGKAKKTPCEYYE